MFKLLRMKFSKSGTYTCDIDTILKFEKIKDKPTLEVVEIWNSFHSVLPECVSLAMNGKKADLLMKRMTAHPMLLQPVIRDLRFFFLLSYPSEGGQLITFHEMEENDQKPLDNESDFILRIFKEFMPIQGITLMRGDIFDKVLSKSEAEIIMRAMVAYYTDNELYYEYTVPFNDDYLNFNHNKFIDEYFERFNSAEYENFIKHT